MATRHHKEALMKEEFSQVYVKNFAESKPQATAAAGKPKDKPVVGMDGEEPTDNNVLNNQDFSIEESTAFIKECYFKKQNYAKTDYSKQYPVWERILSQNLNLCLYGIGTKTKVLDDFLKGHCRDCIQMKIKGYNSSVKADNIFMKMLQTLETFTVNDLKSKVSHLLGMKKHQSDNTVNVLRSLLTEYAKTGLRFLIVFIDLDGKNFREIESHRLLSNVFSHPAVKVIATFSNMNFMYLFSHETMQTYNFAYVPVHTYEPSEVELVADEMCWFNTKQSKNVESIKAIYGALTEIQREILKLLAQKVLASPQNQISQDDLFDACVDDMLVSDKDKLVECLKEAIAHNIVIEKYGETGIKNLKMPNAAEALNIFNSNHSDDDVEDF